MLSRACLTLALISLCSTIPATAQHGVAGLTNPYTSPQDIAAGARIYRSHCAVCHGIEGEGGRGVDLTQGRYRHATSDDELFNVISEGIPGTEMPGIFFNGRQLWQIVAFVRTLSEGKAAQQASGDAAAGQSVYASKGCANCHMVDGSGSRTGPDLSDIGAQRSLAHLEAAVLRPGEKVLPQHWFVRGVAKDGSKVFGRRLNEDTYSVQLLDQNQKLVSVLKADLGEYEVLRESTMPSYQGKLTDKQFTDLIAYLANRVQR